MSDFFPLVKGVVRDYETESSEGEGSFTIEILDVTSKGGVKTAKCRRTMKPPKGPKTVTEYEVTSDASGVRAGDAVEFNAPVKVGTEWIVSPRKYWIESLEAEVETPAGKYAGCMRVAYLIAEGDGGSGERFYAPGVGLVKAVDNDEAEPSRFELVKISA